MLSNYGWQDLLYANVAYNGPHELTFTQDDNDWQLMLDIDTFSQEMVLRADVRSNRWLAIGFADDLQTDADVIYWEAGPTGFKSDSQSALDVDKVASPTLSEEIELRQKSKVYDRISVKNILFDNPEN